MNLMESDNQQPIYILVDLININDCFKKLKLSQSSISNANKQTITSHTMAIAEEAEGKKSVMRGVRVFAVMMFRSPFFQERRGGGKYHWLSSSLSLSSSFLFRTLNLP